MPHTANNKTSEATSSTSPELKLSESLNAAQGGSDSSGPSLVDSSLLLSSMDMQSVTLSFRYSAVEGEYLAVVARSRWPVLVSLFCFDVVCHIIRMTAKCVEVYWNEDPSTQGPSCWSTAWKILPQLSSLAVLYSFIGFLNARSRRLGCAAARQEELLLSACMSMVICNLLSSLKRESAQDYVYVAYFLICTSTFLKIRWWVGTTILIAPILATNLWNQGRQLSILPRDAVVHIFIAWAVGGLMAYLVECYRRKTFASQRMAVGAHAKELLEARERIKAQRQLAAAQAQAAQRALSVAREKAANEAKSEFMSLMCHEVRTPLNGCLASAEMLLETPLQEEQRELAKTIRVSGSILLSTVSNFLDFFKMEAGKALDIVRTEVDLNELVGDLHMIIEAMLGRNGEVNLQPPEVYCCPCRVLCDTDRVRGILLNLYSNAAKFTKQGDIALKVREVGMDYVPQPPEGYSQVTSTPAYQLLKYPDSGPQMPINPLSTSPSLGNLSDLGALRTRPGSTDFGTTGPAPAMVQIISPAVTAPPLDPVSEVDLGRSFHDYDDADRVRGSKEYTQGKGLPLNGGTTEEELLESPWSPSFPNVGMSTEMSLEDSVMASEKWLLFEVQDTGVGISSEGLSTLFQEFVQGTDDEMRKPRTKGGTGLGLSICSKQVGVLGGRIGAMSCPDKGSIFWFVIPLIKPLAISNVGMNSHQGYSNLDKLMPRSETWMTDLPTSTTSSVKNLESMLLAPESAYATSCLSFDINVDNRASGDRSDSAKLAETSELYRLSQPPGSQSCFDPGSDSMSGSDQIRSDHISRADIRLSDDVDLSFSNLPMLRVGSNNAGRRISPALDHTGVPVPAGFLNPGLELAAQPKLGGLPAMASFGTPIITDPGDKLQKLQAQLAALGQRQAQQSQTQQQAARAQPPPRPMPSVPASATVGFRVGGVFKGQRTSDCSDSLSGHTSLTPGACRRSLDMAQLKGMRALLVEDNLINQTVARKMLTSLDIHCTVASNGLEAVQNIERIIQATSSAGTTAVEGGAAPPAPSAPTPSQAPSGPIRAQPTSELASIGEKTVMGGYWQWVGDGPPTTAAPTLAPYPNPPAASVSAPATAPSSKPPSAAASSPQPSDQMFDLILMDMLMPIMGGLDATRAIRQLGCDVPILAMTANASDKDRDQCRSAGMDGFLSKPVLKDRLAGSILEVTATNRRRKRLRSLAESQHEGC